MTRTVIALLAAPALVPLVMFAELSVLATTERWFGMYAVVATAFAYAGVLALGAPILRFTWSRNQTSLWATVLVGVSVSVVTWLAFGVLLGLSLDSSVATAVNDTLRPGFLKGLVWPAGVCGVIVAVAIWAIARPDRRHPQPAAA